MAILLVFLLHYITNSRTHGESFGLLYRFSQIFRLGWSGVDLFFVLSGFLIGGILLDAKTSTNYFRTFYIRRAHRILPVYYLWIIICSCSSYIILKCASTRDVMALGTLAHPLIYALFLQNIFAVPASFLTHYLLSPAWSLAVEEQFYLVAPFLIRFLNLRRLIQVLLACVLGAPILRYIAFSLLSHGADRAYTLMPCRADALAMGMLAAIAWRTPVKERLLRHKLYLRIVSGALLAGAAAMIKWMPAARTGLEAAFQYTWTGLLYTSILLIVLLDGRSPEARVCRWRLLRELGRISYCFYLIHLGILGACHWLFFRSLPRINDWPGVAVTAFAALLSLATARLSWRFFEKPLIDRGHTRTYAGSA